MRQDTCTELTAEELALLRRNAEQDTCGELSMGGFAGKVRWQTVFRAGDSDSSATGVIQKEKQNGRQ